LKVELPESENAGTKTDRVWHEIAIQGHSRSFILQPFTSQQK